MGRNFDYPHPLRGRMAKTYLRQLTEDASRLDRVLKDDDTLPAWVEYYIASSADRVNTLSRYMGYQVAHFRPSGQFRQNPKEEKEKGGFDPVAFSAGLTSLSALVPQVIDVATLGSRQKHEQAMGKITGKTERFLAAEASKQSGLQAQAALEAEATRRTMYMWGFGAVTVIAVAMAMAFRK